MDNRDEGEMVKFWFVCFVCSVAKWPGCRAYIIYKRRPKTRNILTQLVLSRRRRVYYGPLLYCSVYCGGSGLLVFRVLYVLRLSWLLVVDSIKIIYIALSLPGYIHIGIPYTYIILRCIYIYWKKIIYKTV